MIPFHTRFPELAARETRSLHVLGTNGPLPIGEYGFIEHYCTDPSCDCRRVLVCVTSARPPHPVLATINYGWESPEFYTRWMHGDPEAGREITAASLDPLNPQSQHAELFLEFFQKSVLSDPAYVARLARHYELFKSTQNSAQADWTSSTIKTSVAPDEGPGSWDEDTEISRETDSAPAKIRRNDPCPCGSGRKYKKCCGKS